jgi:chemotaxis protein methyltransferase CheR
MFSGDRAPERADPVSFLASGELSAEDAEEFRALKLVIRRRAKFDCDGYKEKCLRRRIAVRMRARAVHRYGDYALIVDSDPDELDRLLKTITINVSKFFRNFEVWDLVRREVVPALFAVDASPVRIWSAGSASGEEPYTVAILLLEYAREHGLEDRLSRMKIVATDVNRQILERARVAEYGEQALEETPPELRDRWFRAAGTRFRLRDEVKGLVHFAPLDLLTDPFPGGQHLILCRNVTIYFERSVQERLLRELHRALVPGGYLVLGKVEAILGSLARNFETVGGPERIFRRI